MDSWHQSEYSNESGGRGLSISSPNNYVPVSRYSAQVHPQYNFYESSLQPYRPHGYQQKVVNVSQTYKVKDTSANKPKSCTDKITISHTIGFISGLIFLGIPLGVLITMYMLYSPTTTTSRIVSATISTAVNLPYQCTSYGTINDQTRVYTYQTCCPCDSGYSGWYRFTGLSGSQLVTYPINYNYCGSYAPGWWNGTHPTTVGATAIGYLCVSYSGYICHSSYSVGPVVATNCSGYYVYYLRPTTCTCCWINPRYCTM